MALRRATAALASLGERWSAASTSLAAVRAQGPAIVQASRLQQVRPHISVDVQNNNVERAARMLQRKLQEERHMQVAQRQQFYVKPSERRKLAAAASQKRFRQKEFRAMLQWVMQRKSRGF